MQSYTERSGQVTAWKSRFVQRREATVELTLDSLMPSSPRIPTPAWKDEDLVEECLKGNQHAWAAVVDKYKGLVYASIKSRVSSQDTTDLFQQVWLDLYSELKNLRKPGAVADWLITVIWHKCFRRESAVKETPLLEWKELVEGQQMLRDTIAQLPDCCRRMVDLLFHSDPPISCAEAAMQLESAEGPGRVTCGRCLENLRSILEQKGF